VGETGDEDWLELSMAVFPAARLNILGGVGDESRLGLTTAAVLKPMSPSVEASPGTEKCMASLVSTGS
jgi:hypothetical protein